ncbi:DUF4124 domain-containing protein [Oleiagrimonas sp. C23AA]|uniref:DUF4124 domain-containing protein n=1 Tax=Oleiagrimonas sp. C23AA TaxID=2719047 RepID=UPI00141D9744|nr:DUF4124 domain-containing protein [Oleiagrimonas sp. C23AA]NII10590.1 DUF4124 domain-containing protein [Oleiagrimonas sp. C23AA]
MRHTRLVATIAATLALAAGASARAQHGKADAYHYRWTDSHGQAHYSDSLTQDAINHGYQVLNNAGLVVRKVKRPLTAAERADAEARDQAAADKRDADARRQREDAQLLAAYPTYADFKTAQQAELDHLDQSIHTTQLNLSTQEQALSDLLNHAADLESANKPVPKFLNDRIAKQRKAVREQRDTLSHLQDERRQASQREAKQLEHYRQLRDAQDARDHDQGDGHADD